VRKVIRKCNLLLSLSVKGKKKLIPNGHLQEKPFTKCCIDKKNSKGSNVNLPTYF
jgi:hypothetical protein